jgi:hypothetical protein
MRNYFWTTQYGKSKNGSEDIHASHWICLCNGNESLHEISNDNWVRVVNAATSKNLVKSTMLPLRNFHKYTWTSPGGKSHSQIDHILIGEGIRVFLMFDHSGQQIVILAAIWW